MIYPLLLALAGFQGEPGGSIVPQPAKVTFECGHRGTLTQSLHLRSTKALKGLQYTTLPLRTGDGCHPLGSDRVKVLKGPTELPVGPPIEVQVRADTEGVPSGEYAGEILITYEGGSLSIPVTVRAKDGPELALLLLLLGIGLAIALSAYRTVGRRRDLLVNRGVQLRALSKLEPNLAPPFDKYVEGRLDTVAVLLDREKWDEAERSLNEAEAAWLKWRTWHADWMQLFGELDRLRRDIDRLGPGATKDGFRRKADDAVAVSERAPTAEGSADLLTAVKALRAEWEMYVEARSLFERLEALGKDKADPFRHRLLATPIDGVRALRDELSAAVARLEAAPAALQSPRAPLIAHPPTLDASKYRWARFRLKAFTLASYATFLLMLAAIGFWDLYVSKPTFGSKPLLDYLTLFAWGFGAEATRASVEGLFRTWGFQAGPLKGTA